MARIDERNNMFSRMTRVEGTREFDDYYKAHPENLAVDGEIKALPPMNGDQTRFHDSMNSPLVDAAFKFLADIRGLVDGGDKAGVKIESTPEAFTGKIKGLAELYGAKKTGVALLDDSYYYAQRGRTDQVYGEIVAPYLPYTFVFAVEMDQDYINTAPLLAQSIAVTKGYVDAAIIGLMITYYIKSLGYEARNHMDGNYLLVLPLAAKAARLGDLGRHGLLVTPEYGSRIRLGAVTTNLPLIKSEPSSFTMRDFCKQCGRCATLCPAQAISKNPPAKIEGVERWQIRQELCFKKWMEFGTDCGMCMAACPFSLPLEKPDLEQYRKDPDYAAEILKKYSIGEYRKRVNAERLKWLK